MSYFRDMERSLIDKLAQNEEQRDRLERELSQLKKGELAREAIIKINDIFGELNKLNKSSKKIRAELEASKLKVNQVKHFEVVTPELAKKYLFNSTKWQTMEERGQYRIDVAKIDKIAADIKAGRFIPENTTSPVQFLAGGNELINGHHRMHAIIIANMLVKLWVEREPEE